MIVPAVQSNSRVWYMKWLFMTWFFPGHISMISDQNGISPLYIIVEIYHSGQKSWIFNQQSDVCRKRKWMS